jgi:dienelactone hydrolase
MAHHPRAVSIPPVALKGELCAPPNSRGLVIFAHGSGSSRFSPRNRAVADALVSAGFATLLFDLLTPEEAEDRANVFDIGLLGTRLADAVAWARVEPDVGALPIGLFGASTGAAAAIRAAAKRPADVQAVVSRGGRPDLAGDALSQLSAPTLLIVGGHDEPVIGLNREALARIRAPAEITVVPRATHLFEEPGALEQVIALAIAWFGTHLAALSAPTNGQGGYRSSSKNSSDTRMS